MPANFRRFDRISKGPRRQVRFGTNSATLDFMMPLLQTLGTFYNRGAALMTVPIEVDGTAFELGPQRIGPDTTRAPAQPGSR